MSFADNAWLQTRDIVLGSGKKAVQAYCTLLLSKKPNNTGEESSTTVGSMPGSNTGAGKS
ncbi:hypothetical protein PINS_up004747 [Pythium insidiosum]|nr:hypothetical protein PINS_up004747 [Pythium insidiosum]